MRRAPAKPVRACTLRNWCRVAHVTFEAPRHTSHLTVFTLHTAPFAINTSHFSLHTALSPIHTSQYKTSQYKTFPRNTKLQKVCPSITLEHKAYTKHFPVLLCTTKLAESTIPKLRKSADKALSQPRCNHSNTICDVQLQRTIVLRMQPQHRATLTQPLVTTMRSADTELQTH